MDNIKRTGPSFEKIFYEIMDDQKKRLAEGRPAFDFVPKFSIDYMVEAINRHNEKKE